MPEVITCPECEGQLRIKDEMLGKKIKCPKCQNQFVAKGPEAAEEIDEMEELDEAPAKPARRDRRDEEDEDDRPRKKRRDDDEEDEDDRPRKKSRRDEEDEDDDRPRKRRRDDDDEDEYEDVRKPKGPSPKAMLKKARLSVKLLFIGTIITLSAVGVMFLLQILSMTVWFPPDWLSMLLVGIPGLGGSATFATGLVFGIFGPPRRAAFGLAIAAAAVGCMRWLFQLIVGINAISYMNASSMGVRTMGIDFGGFERAIRQRFGGESLWNQTASAIPAVTRIGSGMDVVAFLAGLLEIATLVLLSLWLRALMGNYQKKMPALGQFLVGICLAGGVPLAVMLLNTILHAAAPFSQATFWIAALLTGAGTIAIWVIYLMMVLNLRTFLQHQRVT